VTETDPAPIGDDNDVVEEIIDIGQSLMGWVEADRARPDSKPLFSSPSKNQRLWKYGADE